MKIEGEFQNRTTTPECSKDRTVVPSVVETEVSFVCAHNVCVLNNMHLRATLLHYYKTVWSMSSVKTSILSASLRKKVPVKNGFDYYGLLY